MAPYNIKKISFDFMQAYIILLYVQEIETTHIFLFWRRENIK